jgi:hypothetical protein
VRGSKDTHCPEVRALRRRLCRGVGCNNGLPGELVSPGVAAWLVAGDAAWLVTGAAACCAVLSAFLALARRRLPGFDVRSAYVNAPGSAGGTARIARVAGAAGGVAGVAAATGGVA